MTDERDPKVTRRYRELGAEEPSRELDQAILAAAHRAADRPHAPLVTPAGRHRWYFAFGAAAILVLAVAVTVQVERQQPDPEALPASSAAVRSDRAEGVFFRQEEASESRQAEVKKQPERPRPFSDAAPPARQARRAPAQEAPPAASPSFEAQSQTGPAPAAKPESAESFGLRERDLGEANRVETPPASAPAPAPVPENRDPAAAAAEADRRAGATIQPREAQRVQRAPAAQSALRPEVMARVQVSPEELLQRIAELRKDGRHDEADKLLAEFRQRYPDYRISEEMLQKVQRKK